MKALNDVTINVRAVGIGDDPGGPRNRPASGIGGDEITSNTVVVTWTADGD